MNERANTINQFYSNEHEEDRLETNHGKVEFIISTDYIDKYLKPDSKILEIGAGTGKYSLYYASKGYDVTAIELADYNIDYLKSKITPDMKIRAEQGDAVDLSRFPDDTFDTTLVLGPLYHLFDQVEINKALDEAIRVTKKGGKIYYAFLPNDSVVISWILLKRNFDKKGISFNENFELNKKLDEIFVTFYIDEFRGFFKDKPVKELHMVATDGMSHHLKTTVDELDDYEFSEWVRYCRLSAEKPKLLGYSNHALFICEKNNKNVSRET